MKSAEIVYFIHYSLDFLLGKKIKLKQSNY